MTQRGRRGIALPLVVVLIAIAGGAIFVFQHVVQQEAHGTHKLVRTLHAEAICDRVVNRIAAVVGQHPWEDRFYLLDAMARAPGASTMPEAKYLFDQDKFPFGDEGAEFAAGDASFTGSVKDTSALEQRYRVTVRARYKGVSVLGVYDLTHARGTMGPLNRSAIDLRKMKVDDTANDGQLDQEMDAIPIEALKPENVLGPNFPVPSIPAIFPPPGSPPPPSTTEQTAGLVGGKLVPAFNPPVGITPGTPEANAVANATATTSNRAGGRAENDFTRTQNGQIPPNSTLQPGAPVKPPRPPAGPPPDPGTDPFQQDPGGLGNDGGTYTPAGWDPSLGNGSTEYNQDGTQGPMGPPAPNEDPQPGGPPPQEDPAYNEDGTEKGPGAPYDPNDPTAPAVQPSEDPTTTPQVEEDPSTKDPSTQDPSTKDPSTQDPSTQDPSTQEPATQEPATQEPATQEPATQEPATQQQESPPEPAPGGSEEG